MGRKKGAKAGKVKDEKKKKPEENEDETTEEETDESEEGDESEEDSTDEEESEEGDESEEDVDSEVETEDATGEVVRYGVYKGPSLVAIYNVVNHGPDFVKLAKARAKKIDGEARPYVDPKQPEVEKTVVNIVNASGSLIRQFAKSTHGKDYEKLAADFLEKHGVKRGYKVQD